MSLIEKKNLNYLTTVEQFFVSLKNSGLTLSANDYHLISQWEQRNIPLRVLCRSIEKCYIDKIKRNKNSFSKVSLSFLRESIEDEIHRMENP